MISKFWTALEGLIPFIIYMNFYIIALLFSNIAFEEPIWVFSIMSSYFVLSSTKTIICNLVKVDFSIFDDFHLTVPILVSTIAYPLNSVYLKQDEKLLS